MGSSGRFSSEGIVDPLPRHRDVGVGEAVSRVAASRSVTDVTERRERSGGGWKGGVRGLVGGTSRGRSRANDHYPQRGGQGEVRVRERRGRGENRVDDTYGDLRAEYYQANGGQNALCSRRVFCAQESDEVDGDEGGTHENDGTIYQLQRDESTRRDGATSA